MQNAAAERGRERETEKGGGREREREGGKEGREQGKRLRLYGCITYTLPNPFTDQSGSPPILNSAFICQRSSYAILGKYMCMIKNPLASPPIDYCLDCNETWLPFISSAKKSNTCKVLVHKNIEGEITKI
ncbi:hypothetical protein GDO81_019301 [Engystomops pustulosus]|uniref:Uncharacterized protein n=1 Tax=Engystomops pustulosus TaxID=76066 RepID=A0AAV6ZRD5_ENGPU|nr:hypothetical protein GDO81_019301 [Engystomops pustulosus]